MCFRTTLNLTLILMILPSDLIAIARDEPRALPSDVVADIQTKMDDLTAGGLPTGMVVA